MNLNDDVVYRCLRLGSLHQRHPGCSRSLVRHNDRLHGNCLLGHLSLWWKCCSFKGLQSSTTEGKTMKIVVIGGTGLIGSKTVAILRRGGHEVVAASPKSGINSITGEGLKEAMAGAQVVIDLANSPSFEDKAVLEFFETSGRNLLAAEAAAGVRHHVALSIVGTDRSDIGYFRAKVAQEKLIETSGIPYTIIRSTQFLEFLGGIAASSADGNIVRISPALFQPIAADDVAAIVADVALAAPRNGIVEIAGPERAPFNEIVARYLKAVGDPREVVSDPRGPILRRPGRGALAR